MGRDPEPGRALLAALPEGAVPLVERVEELTYLEGQTMDDHRHTHGWRRCWKGHDLREFGDGAIDAFVSRGVGRGDGDPDPATDESRIAAARRYGAAIEPFASGA